MQTEARIGMVVEGGQRAPNASNGAVPVDGSSIKLSQQHQQQHQQEVLEQRQAQIGTVSQLLAGGVAGALSKTCTAPLARLTILFQIQGMHSEAATLKKASIWREASRIIGEEGVRAFWKGNLVTIAHRLPYSSVNFYAYESYKKFLHLIPGLENHVESMSRDLCIHFVAGGLAGVTAATATYPLDLVRTRLAAQTNVMYYKGIWHAIQTISKEEGVRGLYKGLGATLLGVGPSIAISFSAYETLRSYWQLHRPHDSTILVSLACGSLSGIASSTVKDVLVLVLHQESNQTYPVTLKARDQTGELFSNMAYELLVSHFIMGWHFSAEPILFIIKSTFPLDLVRRRKQLEGAGGRARVYNTGLFGIFRHIIRTEGIRGLYRGILPEYYKVVPGVGICFMTYETLKMLLANMATDS